jgi:hypothetical protein
MGSSGGNGRNGNSAIGTVGNRAAVGCGIRRLVQDSNASIIVSWKPWCYESSQIIKSCGECMLSSLNDRA